MICAAGALSGNCGTIFKFAICCCTLFHISFHLLFLHPFHLPPMRSRATASALMLHHKFRLCNMHARWGKQSTKQLIRTRTSKLWCHPQECIDA